MPRLVSSAKVVVAIPVRNESDEIADCLHALRIQQGASIDAVALCLNNCTDDTAHVVRRIAAGLPFAVDMQHAELPLAAAGLARRIAMDCAADLAGPQGTVLTTDADGRATPQWLAANLAALRRGADVAAGQVDIEPEGAMLIPAHLHAIDARECAYAALLDEICSIVDADPADPWPRHDEHSGASIAVTVAAYRRVGGVPPIALGEDRALFDALRRVDARIRHEPAARVVVSARIFGRAPGGMADTLRRRMQQVDEFLDDRLEPTIDALRRARLRARLRGAWLARQPNDRSLAMRLGVPAGELNALLTARHFGAAWAEVEQRSPTLQRRRVALVDLSQQTAAALRLRDALRARKAISLAADPVDSALRVAAE